MEGAETLLDAKDEALWSALEADPSSTNRALSRQLSIPETEVARRLRRLDDLNLMRLTARVDLTSAGYGAIGHISIDCRLGEEPKLAAEIMSSPMAERLLWLDTFQDQGGLDANLRLVNSGELRKFAIDVLRDLPSARAFSVDLTYQVLFYRSELLPPVPSQAYSVPQLAEYLRQNVLTRELDELDASIIAELEIDARRSIRSVAREHHVTEGAIRYRLKRLDEIALLSIGPARHPSTRGVKYNLRAHIRTAPDRLFGVSRDLQQADLMFASLVTGRENLRVAFAIADEAHLHRRINSLREHPGIESVRTEILKELYYWDPRWCVSSRRNLLKAAEGLED
jgi:DNA-binding Lrp family transcriptional regulator